MEEQNGWKNKVLIIGAVVGAIAGVIGAYIIIQKSETAPDKPKLTAGEGVKVGLGVLGLLRMLSESGNKR